MHLKIYSVLLFSAFLHLSRLDGAYTIYNGSIVDTDLIPTMQVEDHYSAAVTAFGCENWYESARHFAIVSYNFPNSPYAQESFFYLGVCWFNVGEYDIANTNFSSYLQGRDHPRLFQEAIEYKYAIAEKFRSGSRRRLLGTKQLPKWATGGTLALSIYDEVVAAMPCHEISAEALYSKALLHRERREYHESVDCLQIAIRRFPKHELTPEYYLLINKIYLDQCRYEFQNPDLLAFAEINLRRFEQQFPREERLCEAQSDLLAIKEVYGRGLVMTGFFYERIYRPKAAILYYQSAIRQFPETKAAAAANRRLMALGCPQPCPQAECDPESIDQYMNETSAMLDAQEESTQQQAGEDKFDWIP